MLVLVLMHVLVLVSVLVLVLVLVPVLVLVSACEAASAYECVPAPAQCAKLVRENRFRELPKLGPGAQKNIPNFVLFSGPKFGSRF